MQPARRSPPPLAVALLAAAWLAAPAHAQRWNGAVAVATDKVQRGLTQNAGRTVWMADVGVTTDTGWNAGLGWARPVYQALGGTGEITLSAGKAWQLDDGWVLQAAAVHYAYTGHERVRDASYTELSAAAGWQGRLVATVVLTPDASGFSGGQARRGLTAALEIGARQRLAGQLALEAGVGYNAADDVLGGGYGYGSVGLRFGVGPVSGQLTWIGSQSEARTLAPGRAGTRLVGSLGWAF